MKKNILKTFVSVVLTVSLITCFSSCKDNLDGCGLTVIVKDQATGQRVSGAAVHIYQGTGTITRDGVTDNNGEAYFFFNHEAIFNIDASLSDMLYTKTGSSSVRLVYDKVLSKEVIIQ